MTQGLSRCMASTFLERMAREYPQDAAALARGNALLAKTRALLAIATVIKDGGTISRQMLIDAGLPAWPKKDRRIRRIEVI